MIGDNDKSLTILSDVGGLVGSKVNPASANIQSGMSLLPTSVARLIAGLRTDAAL